MRAARIVLDIHRLATGLASGALILVANCGARSALIVPDVPNADVFDADTADAADVRDGSDADAMHATDVGLPPVDPMCPGTCPYAQLPADFPPYTPLVPPDVPASCANGFELGGANGGCGRSTYRLPSTRPGGANAITLDVDFATYHAPDGVTVTGRDAAGHTYTLLLTCRLQTSTLAGPSTMRPADDTIRQFRLDVRAGTTELDFDFGAVTTPMYIRVLGLCDFDVSRYPRAAFWRAIP